MSVDDAAHAVAKDPQQFERAHPGWNHRLRLGHLADGVGLEVHVFAGIGESRGKLVADGYRHLVVDQREHPVKVAEIAPFRVEENAALRDDLAPDENAAGQHREAEPDLPRVGHHRVPVAKIVAVAIGDDAAGEQHLDAGVGEEKLFHGGERAGEVLFIAVQIRENVAGGAPVAAVHGVIHALVLFDDGPHARVLRQPVLRAVIGAGILHDVLQFHVRPLVGDRRDAELEPGGIAEAGRDDGKLQMLGLRPALVFQRSQVHADAAQGQGKKFQQEKPAARIPNEDGRTMVIRVALVLNHRRHHRGEQGEQGGPAQVCQQRQDAAGNHVERQEHQVRVGMEMRPDHGAKNRAGQQEGVPVFLRVAQEGGFFIHRAGRRVDHPVFEEPVNAQPVQRQKFKSRPHQGVVKGQRAPHQKMPGALRPPRLLAFWGRRF